MKRFRQIFSILMVTSCLVASLWFAWRVDGDVNATSQTHEGDRSAICQLLAMRVSLAAADEQLTLLTQVLRDARANHPDLQSIRVLRPDGSVVSKSGPHDTNWRDMDAPDRMFDQVSIPIRINDKPWGDVQATFTASGTPAQTTSPSWSKIMPIVAAAMMVFSIMFRYRRRRLRRALGLSARVKTVLSTITESIIVADRELNIVFANKTFGEHTGIDCKQLLGTSLGELQWIDSDGAPLKETMPWTKSLESGDSVAHTSICMTGAEYRMRNYSANCAPIFDDSQMLRGILISLGDVTALRIKQAELEAHLELLDQAHEEIERINVELKQQASHDPLTGCLNRRAFLEQAEPIWTAAERHGHVVASVLVDVDHFKSINDTHGHGVGDDVLRGIAETLNRNKRDEDLLCRWGGEEFCFLLVEPSENSVAAAAERLRESIAGQPISDINITASFGVAVRSGANTTISELVDRADEALYVSKRSGRNKVTLWNSSIADDAVSDEKTPTPQSNEGTREVAPPSPPPYQTFSRAG